MAPCGQIVMMNQLLWKSRALRATVIVFAVSGSLVAVVPGCLITQLGGAFEHEPEEADTGLSPEAGTLIERSFEGIDSTRLFDYHTHLVGLGDSGSGCQVNSRVLSWSNPFARFRFLVYASASGIDEPEAGADVQYVERLARLARNIEGHGKYLLLALDRYHTEDGNPDPERTEYYTPNEYAVTVAVKHPDLFVPAVSIHPYRPDAIPELERWAKQGVKVVKWIPSAMGIDLSSIKCERFYRVMRKHQMILLTHAGDEHAVETEGGQELGNPLLLRTPLDAGIKVIAAHAASLGESADLDSPDKQPVHNFDLLLRLMSEEKYLHRLFADISAIPQFNRMDRVLQTLLQREDLHPRLINGSDYPLPAVNLLIRLGRFVEAGLVTEKESEALAQIYNYNPLLFDFVLKRTVRLPGADQGFPPSVFMRHEALPPVAPAY